MRQFATGLNRTWLGLIGLLLLLLGLASLAVGTGRLSLVLGDGPRADDPLLGPWVSDVFADTAAVVGIGLVAVLVALLGLGWLLAQVPRTNAAAVYRLQDDATRGLTTCAPAVLTGAFAEDLQTLPGVVAADAVLRGTAQEPELTVRLTATDRTDIPSLLAAVQAGPVANLATALEASPTHLAVQIDISPERRTSDRVTL
jgi:hypothetical protein